MGNWKRIFTSQKIRVSVAGVVGGVLVVLFDVDYTQEILTLITMVTGLLVAGQTALDFKHGSKSDGTGEFKA